MEKQPQQQYAQDQPQQQQQQQDAPAYYPQQAQMLPQAAMRVYPNPLNLAVDPKDGKREFSHTLCSCCDTPGLCLMSCCCSCIVYGKSQQRLAARKANLPPTEASMTGSDCCIYYLVAALTGCGCVLDCSLRGDVQKRYNIKGGACGNCCISSFCHSCNQVQVQREIEEEEQQYLAQYGHQQS